MSPHKPMGEFDGEAVARMLRFLIVSPQGLVLTNGEGAIGGMLAPVYFNPGKFIMEEAFLWARRGGRDLLRYFCEEATKMGADFVSMSTLENDKVNAMHRFVTRMGFIPLERRYLKGLSK